MLPGWVPLASFARERGVTLWTMRRRVLALDHAEGGGLVKSFHRRGRPRKYWVSPDRLKAALERDPDASEAKDAYVDDRLTRVEEKCEALKKAVKAVKAQQKQMALDFSRGASSDSVGQPPPVTK